VDQINTKRNSTGLSGKRHLFALMAALCALTSCDGSNVKSGDKDYPKLNPGPIRFMSLHGTIDPSLKVKFHIQWIADNPNCRYALSWIEGAFGQYNVSEDFPIELNGSSFSTRIPIDGVLPGPCQWRFMGLSYSGDTGSNSSLVQTNSYPLRPGQSPNGIIHLHCSMRKFIPAEKENSLICYDPSDSRETGALRGVLWWHPEATDLEVHFDADGSS
jgi:hypothetical protein